MLYDDAQMQTQTHLAAGYGFEVVNILFFPARMQKRRGV
jgi:hypothetical protein